MGKRKVFILFLILCFFFVGCSNLKESTVNTDELNTVQGIFMSDVSLEDKRFAFILINETDETIYYGEDISLEKTKMESGIKYLYLVR